MKKKVPITPLGMGFIQPYAYQGNAINAITENPKQMFIPHRPVEKPSVGTSIFITYIL